MTKGENSVVSNLSYNISSSIQVVSPSDLSNNYFVISVDFDSSSFEKTFDSFSWNFVSCLNYSFSFLLLDFMLLYFSLKSCSFSDNFLSVSENFSFSCQTSYSFFSIGFESDFICLIRFLRMSLNFLRDLIGGLSVFL